MTEPLVAILDDEPQIRTMLSEALTEAGFRTAAFARATEFEAALKRQTPDVCLVDLGLPDRDGLALVHRLALESGGGDHTHHSGRAQVAGTGSPGWNWARTTTSSNPSTPPRSWPASVPACAGRAPAARKRIQTAEFQRLELPIFDRYLLVSADGTEVAMSHAEGEVLRLFLQSPKTADFP